MLYIVGIVGVPRTYGGFETLADYLLDSPALRQLGTVVFCEQHVVDQQGDTFKGARLEPLRWRANGWQSVLFDSWGLWKGSRRGGVVLVLGTSATFWLPILRRLFPKVRYVVNMAGLEWARSKWGGLARRLLKYNEAAAARHAHAFIADNQGLIDYVTTTYERDAILIAYGGDQFEDVLPDASVFDSYDLPERYDFAMARAQVDNNVEMILDAYVASKLPLVFVSNWDFSEFGREVRNRYAGHPNIHLIGPVYEAAKVKALHQRARLYVHGHSAGGTNPVLVEAMWASLPTLAFDVPFNRYTTHERAFYFTSSTDLVTLSTELTQRVLTTCKQALRDVAERHYRWDAIREAYEDIVLSMEIK
jgi:glycosyltransferase involved in cell wall biosynthesis